MPWKRSAVALWDFDVLKLNRISSKFFHAVQQTEQGRRFEDVLKAMNLASLVTMAQRVFDLFDGNKDGCVDMREIIVGFFSE